MSRVRISSGPPFGDSMEIETKFKTDNLGELKEKLINIGASFSEEVVQIDEWFMPEHKLNDVQRPGDWIIRIRDVNGEYSVTLKGLTDKTGVWIEHELKIDNPDEMRKIFETMKLKKFLVLKKKRICGKVEGFEVCLDDVEGLGKYLEVEIISDDADDGKAKIDELRKKLGIDDDAVEHRGYVAILQQQRGVKFEGTEG